MTTGPTGTDHTNLQYLFLLCLFSTEVISVMETRLTFETFDGHFKTAEELPGADSH